MSRLSDSTKKQIKARYELIPALALDDVALLLTKAAEKHEARGWEKGRSWAQEFAALMRHLWAFRRGHHIDPEYGLSHLTHAAARVLILLEMFLQRIGTDDLTSPTSNQAKENGDATKTKTTRRKRRHVPKAAVRKPGAGSAGGRKPAARQRHAS